MKFLKFLSKWTLKTSIKILFFLLLIYYLFRGIIVGFIEKFYCGAVNVSNKFDLTNFSKKEEVHICDAETILQTYFIDPYIFLIKLFFIIGIFSFVITVLDFNKTKQMLLKAKFKLSKYSPIIEKYKLIALNFFKEELLIFYIKYLILKFTNKNEKLPSKDEFCLLTSKLLTNHEDVFSTKNNVVYTILFDPERIIISYKNKDKKKIIEIKKRIQVLISTNAKTEDFQ